MAESAGDNRKLLEDEPARLDQSKGKNSEDEPVGLNQDMIGAGSSTAEYTGTKRRRSQVEQARPNQDMINLEVESKYDVFLSSAFGITGFAYDLYNHLTAEGICVFKDDEIPNTSEEFPLSVYNSKIYVPIFAECYADNSRWLDTLALMVEQTYSSGGKKAILPIFCNGDGQLETTSVYGGALDTWTKNYGPEKAERWKKAVVEAGKFSKWRLRLTRGERAITTDIVGNILHKLMMEQNYKSGDLSTGDNPMSYHGTSELEDRQKSKIMELLELEVNDIRVVGIHGRDGIGKTTLAKNIYDQICLRFDACSFLAEIEQTTEQPGGVRYLQTKLIFDILKKECEVASAFKGVRYLKEIFRNMKVLIVLDDVESESLLKDFVGAKLDWFGPGSRIIVTSKEGRVFQDFVARGLAHIYDVIPMDVNLAFNILWQNAVGIGKSDKLSPYVIGMDVNRAFDVLWQNPSGIRKSGELRSYVKIAIVIVKAAKGLPLLLKVFGSFLRYKRLENWIKFEDLIQQFQEDHQKILRIIYDALDQQQKQMYLDIACFPPDVDYGIASCMLHHFVYPQDKIRFLHVRCLITMEKNKIGMHSMLRCLARKIIREGFHDPGTGVGLDLPAIAQDTNERKKGTDHLNTEEAGFEIPPDTTFLSLGDANIGGHFANALLKVRWLHWQGCPRDAINIHLEKNENLVILDLSWSKFTESWEGWKRIKMERLKVLNLTGCVDLLVTPSFSCCPKLELLILERCSRLVHLDPSINDLKLLVTLNLKFCSELSMLPVEMGGMNALKELLIDGTSIRELPESIGKLVQLQILSATNCFSLARVPGSVCGLEDLKELAMDDGKFLELPESLGNLWRLRRLSLRNCRGLGKLPESIGKLQYSLVELDISGTGISRLPDSTKCLCRLKVLKMDSCFLREFPDYIGKLSSLEEINASWCRSLEGVIPSSIWRLKFLKELRLRGTRISSLPPQIEYIHGLQTLDLLHCNLLQELPMLCPRDLSCLYVNPDFKQKMLERSEYRSWWRLLQ